MKGPCSVPHPNSPEQPGPPDANSDAMNSQTRHYHAFTLNHTVKHTIGPKYYRIILGITLRLDKVIENVASIPLRHGEIPRILIKARIEIQARLKSEMTMR